MVKRKKKMNNIGSDVVEGITPALTLGGGAIGSSLIGQKLGPKLPPGTVNPLTATGTTFASFVGPVATIGATGVVLKQINRIPKPKPVKFKKRRRRL